MKTNHLGRTSNNMQYLFKILELSSTIPLARPPYASDLVLGLATTAKDEGRIILAPAMKSSNLRCEIEDQQYQKWDFGLKMVEQC